MYFNNMFSTHVQYHSVGLKNASGALSNMIKNQMIPELGIPNNDRMGW
jgi:hypothetical protein